MKLTGLEIPCIYQNVNEYLLFEYTDEIELGKELCSVRLIRLETADLFKTKISASIDDESICDEYIAVITYESEAASAETGLVNKVRDYIMEEIPGLTIDKLDISIKV